MFPPCSFLPFRPAQRHLLFALWISHFRDQKYSAQTWTKLFPSSLPGIVTSLRLVLFDRVCRSIVAIVSMDCSLMADYRLYFYVFHVESFFLMLFRRNLYRNSEGCILFELYSSIKFRNVTVSWLFRWIAAWWQTIVPFFTLFYIQSIICSLVADYRRYFYVFHVENFFLTLFSWDLYRDDGRCLNCILRSSFKV